MSKNSCIIAGSRSIVDFEIVKQAILDSKFVIDEVVSGNANGVDILGEQYAAENNIPVKKFIPNWDDLTEKPCFVKLNKFGKKYNAMAGFNRNKRMAEYASHLIVIHNGSSGSRDMLRIAKEHGLIIYEKIVK